MFQKRDWNVRKKSGGGTLPGRVESLGLGRRNCSRGATDWGVGSRVDCWGGVGATNKKLFLIADAAQMDEIGELSTNICMMVRIQLANIDSDEGPSYDSAFISKLIVALLYTIKKDHDSHDNELEQLARSAYKEAEKQQIIAQKVKQQNVVLTKQLEQYKERVRVFETNNATKTNFHKGFIKADRQAKRLATELQNQFILI
ncbi:hypothetical protein Tco_0910994 [Tanacetum coccineum]|uniref:Uncharacterized protein n=1 Tax=Tanacetum coccineum TaxID=301880 RepID=A0ABQ5D0S7_9ASTR